MLGGDLSFLVDFFHWLFDCTAEVIEKTTKISDEISEDISPASPTLITHLTEAQIAEKQKQWFEQIEKAMKWPRFSSPAAEKATIAADAQLTHLLSQPPSDLTAIATAILDENTKTLFAVGMGTTILHTIKDIISTNIMESVGAGIHFFDGITGTISAIQEYRHLSDAKRREKEKAMWATSKLLVSNILNTGTILTLLAQHNVLQGIAATACTPLAGLSLALLMWTATARSWVNTVRGIRKVTNPLYVIEDRLIKADKVNERIKKLEEKSKLVKKNKQQSIEKKIQHWKAEEKRLREQALIIAKVKHAAANDNDKEVFFDKWTEAGLFKNVNTTEIGWYDEPTNIEKNLVKELEKNHKEKLAGQVANSIAWTTAAIGMTLIAVAPFTGPVAPAVMLAGIVVSAVAGAMKLGQLIIGRTANTFASWRENKREKRELLGKYKDKFNLLQELRDDDIKLGYRLSFERNKEKLKEASPAANDTDLEKAWYHALAQKKPKEIKAITKLAIKETIEENRLANALCGEHVARGSEEFNNAIKTANTVLSGKEKQRILHRHARQNVAARFQEHFTSSLFPPSKKRAEIGVKKTDEEEEGERKSGPAHPETS